VTVSIYRSQRYGETHPALKDRDVDPARFANLNRLHGVMWGASVPVGSCGVSR